MVRNRLLSFAKGMLAAVAALLVVVAPARAGFVCGFGSQPTLSDELKSSDVAAVIRLVERPPPAPDSKVDGMPVQNEAEAILCTFEVVQVLKGDEHLPRPAGSAKPRRVEILYFGDHPIGMEFFASGLLEPTGPVWGSPTAISDASRDYLRSLIALPPAGLERRRLFLRHLEHPDPILAADAFDELARLSYADLTEMKAELSRESLLRWIGAPNVSTDRRRLYLRMLSLCANPEDVDLLEGLICNEDKQTRAALDAAIFSYLALRGAAGLPLVEQLFLADPQAEYVETYAAIMAVRQIGSDTKIIAHRRLAGAFRHVLNRPEIADLVVGDLKRWRDWDVLPRLVHLYRTADPKESWVRVPVLLYLRACPLPEAQAQLTVLSKLDPEAAKRAQQFVQPKQLSPDGA